MARHLSQSNQVNEIDQEFISIQQKCEDVKKKLRSDLYNKAKSPVKPALPSLSPKPVAVKRPISDTVPSTSETSQLQQKKVKVEQAELTDDELLCVVINDNNSVTDARDGAVQDAPLAEDSQKCANEPKDSESQD